MRAITGAVPNNLLNLREYEEYGRRQVPEAVARALRVSPSPLDSAFAAYRLRPRVLIDVSKICTATTVFGKKLAMPVIVKQLDGMPRGTRFAGVACLTESFVWSLVCVLCQWVGPNMYADRLRRTPLHAPLTHAVVLRLRASQLAPARLGVEFVLKRPMRASPVLQRIH